MQPNKQSSSPLSDSDLPSLSQIKVKSSSPRFRPSTSTPSSETPTAGAQRRIGIAVDLSDESAFAVKWAVNQYLRPGDAVILIHVRPTSVLYGADWGSVDLSINDGKDTEEDNLENDSDIVTGTKSADNKKSEEEKKKLESDFDNFTVTKSADIAQPLVEAGIPFKIHIVKDHDMKERLCLEVERLMLSAVIMGSRGVGKVKRGSDGRLGSVSDYCVRHCVCPVVVVRFPDDDKEKESVGHGGAVVKVAKGVDDEDVEEEEESEFHDASDERK